MYEEIGGVALVVRLVGSRPSAEDVRRTLGAVDATIRAAPGFDGVLAVAERAWFGWNADDPRATLEAALDLGDRLASHLPALERALGARCTLRFGLWVDRYVAPVGPTGTPLLDEVALGRIFDFPPDGVVLTSEEVFRRNRRRYAFACVPLRRRERASVHAYRPLERKRPSALDHRRAVPTSAYVGRDDDLAWLDAHWAQRALRTQRLALVGPPGAGKTRLVDEWCRRHPEARIASATFSLFGGDLDAFVEQLGQLDAPLDALVLDDLHWATDDAPPYLQRLLATQPACGRLVILCARPSGEALLRTLEPQSELRVPLLPPGDVASLAANLGLRGAAAEHAVRWARGNPLFVEQFAAWAHEIGDSAPADAPRTLRDVITVRIEALSAGRLSALRRRAMGAASPEERAAVERALLDLEAELGRWLDRLETGDYAERADAFGYLTTLEAVDRELIVMAALFGLPPRPRANRIAEALERLLLGSARSLLAHLQAQPLRSPAAALEVFGAAQRAGVCAFDNHAWELAAAFFALAERVAPEAERAPLAERLVQCRRRLDPEALRLDERAAADRVAALATNPAVDAATLPEVWFALALRTGESVYCRRAVAAAEAVGDRAIAAAARAPSRA